MEDIDDSISPPASDPEWKHVRVRALTEVDLSRTWADDYLVCTLLTYPGFSNLKTLRLAECHEITDDMGPIFALALRAGSGSDGDGDGDEEGRSQKETEGALIESPFDAAWTGYAFVRDPPRRICVRLSTLDLSGTFLLGIDGLGDRWEDVEETSEEGSDGGSEGLSEEGSS